ncbi:hypothetical protein RRG08_004317 [Elysia crispata]|uniref:Uncharacterized protein n=1 Tax=Elysia crispata TaxID=231223 RepID=A0AAE1CW70_9GAST|nr:hypothetical protein RRG08_004317 [Elysia crispata]
MSRRPSSSHFISHRESRKDWKYKRTASAISQEELAPLPFPSLNIFPSCPNRVVSPLWLTRHVRAISSGFPPLTASNYKLIGRTCAELLVRQDRGSELTGRLTDGRVELTCRQNCLLTDISSQKRKYVKRGE